MDTHTVEKDAELRAPEVEIEKVRAVGVADLRELASHTVVREAAGTTHQMEFTAGGTARVYYDEAGTLLNVNAESCSVVLTPDGTLLLKSYPVV
jgi:hypothetical protein